MTPTKTLPLTDFLDFAETQEGTFEFWNSSTCALAQFGRHLFPDAHSVVGGVDDFTVYAIDHDEYEKFEFKPALTMDDLPGGCAVPWSVIVEVVESRLRGETSPKSGCTYDEAAT